ATGGAGGITYEWISQDSSNNWKSASTVAGPNNQESYTSDLLFTSTNFKRVATSQICNDSSDAINITVYPAIANNRILGGDNQFACFNTYRTMRGDTLLSGGKPDGDYSYFWEQSSNDTLYTSVGNDTNYVTPFLTLPVYYRRIVFSGDYNQCKDTSNTVYIQINPLPSGGMESYDTTICEGDNVEVRYQLSGNGPWEMIFGLNGNFLHTEQNITLDTGRIYFPVHQTDSFTILRIQDVNICRADLSGEKDFVRVTAFEVPIADAGEDTVPVCGPTIELNALPSVGSGKWTTNSAIQFSNDSAYNSTATSDQYGDFDLYWTETNWKCTTTDTITVRFYEEPQAVFAGEDQELNNDYETMLNADVTSFTGYWTFDSTLGINVDDTLDPKSLVMFDNPGIFMFAWNIQNGPCETITDSLRIFISKIKVFDGFSPNGDGVNDDFYLKLDPRTITTFSVLNRYGTEVYYEEAQDEISWNGNNKNGTPLPNGIYFILIKPGNDIVIKKAIELRR
ncbi:MAG: gliding motility-associated C-terminal domain-containing protein, partial [Bacteroidales bacterium]|nr:gliding motility-associated C-terminal domain-containing protein [Bacteroidales bacterium]